MNILVTNPGRRIYFINFLLELKKKYKSINIHISDCDKQLPTMTLKNVKNHWSSFKDIGNNSCSIKYSSNTH